MIFEKLGMGTVGGIGLCYYEPQTEVDGGRLDSLLLDEGFRMGFEAHLLEVDLDPEGVVKPLLAQVRELGDREVVPEGRDGCEDCERLSPLTGAMMPQAPETREQTRELASAIR